MQQTKNVLVHITEKLQGVNLASDKAQFWDSDAVSRHISSFHGCACPCGVFLYRQSSLCGEKGGERQVFLAALLFRELRGKRKPFAGVPVLILISLAHVIVSSLSNIT